MKRLIQIAARECCVLFRTPILLFCLTLCPLGVVLYFTTLMDEGVPTELPVGVVDLDNTSMTRKLTQKLDAFENSKVTCHYNSIAEARNAIQRNEIYAFIYFPKGTTSKLLASRQPKISFYYSNVAFTSGSLLFKDLKTISTLGSAAVGSAKLTALGKTEHEIHTFLQPITLDLHPLNNPQISYNVYLSSSLIPACLMVFMFLITAYSLGMELKNGTGKELLEMAGGNIHLALFGKIIPILCVFLITMFLFLFYSCYVLGFPHAGGALNILLLGVLAVCAAVGFAVFVFGVLPSLRMSMSICSLWAALSFSLMGATFPLSAMDGPIQAVAQLFPMRHYFLIYEMSVFNGYSLQYVWWNIGALIIFANLPLLVCGRIRYVYLNFKYIP